MTNYMEEMARLLRSEFKKEELYVSENLLPFYVLLAFVCSSMVMNEDVHDAWSAWKHFIEKDIHHDSLKTFDQLPDQVKEYDIPFTNAIKNAVKRYEDEYGKI